MDAWWLDPKTISQTQIENHMKCMKMLAFCRKNGLVFMQNHGLGSHSLSWGGFTFPRIWWVRKENRKRHSIFQRKFMWCVQRFREYDLKCSVGYKVMHENACISVIVPKDVFRGNNSFLSWMLATPGFYYVKKPKRFVILSSDKSSERNLSCFFDIIKPRRGEHSWKEGIVSSEYIFRTRSRMTYVNM